MDDTKLAHLSALTSLNAMMRGGYFSITTVDSVAKMLGSVVDARAYNILRALHCVDWGSIPPELRQEIPALIERCVGVPAYQFSVAAAPLAEGGRQRVVSTLSLAGRAGDM